MNLKRVRLDIVAAALLVALAGCAKVTRAEKAKTSMFIEIESTGGWSVVFHKDTKVMYAVAGSGVFTLLVNPDGTPMLYDGGAE